MNQVESRICMLHYFHDHALMSGYSCNQHESNKNKQDHGLSSEGIKIIYHDVLLEKSIFIF